MVYLHIEQNKLIDSLNLFIYFIYFICVLESPPSQLLYFLCISISMRAEYILINLKVPLSATEIFFDAKSYKKVTVNIVKCEGGYYEFMISMHRLRS